MAIYHYSIKIISRGKGKSAVAAAAYRAGDKILNCFDGITHDYTHKGGVVHTELLLPANAPAGYSDRAVLWNEVENIEKSKNAQLAREIEIALPRELTREQNISLVRKYVNSHFVSAGMCADICIHDKKDGNPHAHIMLTMRPFDDNGKWGAKQRKEYILDQRKEKIYDPVKKQYKCKTVPATDWNEQTKAEEWRTAWAECVNVELEKNGFDARVDHRSYERQGKDEIPTVHLGSAAFYMEKRGIQTERGNLNGEIKTANQRLKEIKARIIKTQKWLEEGKAAAEDQVTDVAAIEENFSSMIRKQMEISGKLKPVERRLDVLKKHIEQADIYKKYKGKKALTESESILYKTAHDYLKGVLNGRNTLPVKVWKEEYANLTGEKEKLYQEYYVLKENIKKAEQARRNIYNVLQQEQKRQRYKNKDTAL